MIFNRKVRGVSLFGLFLILASSASANSKYGLSRSENLGTFEVCATGNEQRSFLALEFDYPVEFTQFYTNYAVRNGERGAKGFDILIDGKSASLQMIPEPEVIVETIVVREPVHRPRRPRRRDPFIRSGLSFGTENVSGSRVEIFAVSGCVELRDFTIMFKDFGVCGDLRYVDEHNAFYQCAINNLASGCFDDIFTSRELLQIETEMNVDGSVLPDVHKDLSRSTQELYSQLVKSKWQIKQKTEIPSCRLPAMNLLKLTRSIGHNAGLD